MKNGRDIIISLLTLVIIIQNRFVIWSAIKTPLWDYRWLSWPIATISLFAALAAFMIWWIEGEGADATEKRKDEKRKERWAMVVLTIVLGLVLWGEVVWLRKGEVVAASPVDTVSDESEPAPDIEIPKLGGRDLSAVEAAAIGPKTEVAEFAWMALQSDAGNTPVGVAELRAYRDFQQWYAENEEKISKEGAAEKRAELLEKILLLPEGEAVKPSVQNIDHMDSLEKKRKFFGRVPRS